MSLCFGQCKQEPRLVGGHSSTWTWYTSGQTTAINWHDAINRQLATVHQSSLGRRWLMNGNKGLPLQCDDSSLYQSICKFESTFMVHSGVNLLIFRADPSSRYSGLGEPNEWSKARCDRAKIHQLSVGCRKVVQVAKLTHRNDLFVFATS